MKRNNDGLVLLYDAAMLLEQHSLGPIGPIPIVNANQSFSSHGIVKRSSKTADTVERAHGLTPAMPIVSMATDPTLQLRPNNYWSLASTSTIAAATASSASTFSPSPTKQRLSATTIRTSHNELEKIRRAKLRTSIDQLKSRLPALRGRVTMLTVLKRACTFVKDLEQKSEEQRAQLRQLERRRMELKMRRGQLTRLLRRLKKQAADAAGASSTSNVSEAAKSFGAKKLRPLTSAMP
uniref:BHLH domain-containing protein n=1 Tax=Macrostomum lignano TaxID=282301 RepID=A0A1I8FZ98_9PLAT